MRDFVRRKEARKQETEVLAGPPAETEVRTKVRERTPGAFLLMIEIFRGLTLPSERRLECLT